MLMTEEKHEYTINEAAQLAGVGYTTIVKWKDQGKVRWRRDEPTGLVYIDAQTFQIAKAAYDLMGPRRRKHPGQPRKPAKRPRKKKPSE
jgi:hypothetical protein